MVLKGVVIHQVYWVEVEVVKRFLHLSENEQLMKLMILIFDCHPRMS